MLPLDTKNPLLSEMKGSIENILLTDNQTIGRLA